MQQQLPPANGVNELIVRKFICVPTEHAYNDVYQRGYTVGATPGELDNLNNFFLQQGVDKNTPISLTSAAIQIPNIVQMSRTPSSKTGIPNGWQTQRLTFLIQVDEVYNNYTTISHYMQGYTENYDPTHTGRLDPNAFYYINSCTDIIRTTNGVTNEVTSRVASSYNLITDPTGVSSYQEVAVPSTGLELIRPTDIMLSLHSNSLYQDTPSATLDIRTTSLNGGNVSSRVNNEAIKYFTKTVNSVITAKSCAVNHTDPGAIIGNASGSVAETSLVDNGFLRRLAHISGRLDSTYFTLNMLQQIQPNIEDIILLVKSGGLTRTPSTRLDTDVTESMLNYTPESEVVQTFINSMASVMTENYITNISGTVTNLTNAPITTITDIKSFLDGVDITPYGNRIINYINTVIMPQITYNGMRLVEVLFSCDLLGDSTVSVSIDGYPYAIFRIPSFADGLFSPVVTSKGNKSIVVENFGDIGDTIMAMAPENRINGY